MKDAYLNLGVDVANRASHVASLADRTGQLVWTNHRFRTTVADLEELWSMIPRGAVVTVVLEPTGNASNLHTYSRTMTFLVGARARTEGRYVGGHEQSGAARVIRRS
jgi:hypothetical protein